MGVICVLCRSRRNTKFMTLADFQSNHPVEKFEYLQCLDCGLVFLPGLSGGYNPEEYPVNYEPHQDHRSLSRKRFRAVEKHKREGKILDIGCGSGEFLTHFAGKPNWFPFGIEPAPGAAARAASKSERVKIVQGTLQPDLFSVGFFDVVTLWDVLEHLSNPVETLGICYNLLIPGGLLVLRVPNLDSRDFRLFRKYWAGLDAPRHKVVFNRNTITRMVTEIGFTIFGMKSNIGYLHNFMGSMEYWHKGTKEHKMLSKTILLVLKNPVVQLICAPFFHFAGEGTRGSELVITAGKPHD